jgi:hypothetical protein
MRPYTDEELSKSIFYPACGFDFTPLLIFRICLYMQTALLQYRASGPRHRPKLGPY